MMIHTLVRGQKIDVTRNHPEMKGLLVDLTWNAPMNMDVDASAFLVGFNGKITKEEDFVFYGQPFLVVDLFNWTKMKQMEINKDFR